MKLSDLEWIALRRVTARASAGLRAATLRSLERKGLIEHTSLGWRATPDGRDLIGGAG